STRLPAIGPPVAQLPATSQTVWLLVTALPLLASGATEVASAKLASAGSARPEPVSVAVHASVTFTGCHAPSGSAHAIAGGVWSFEGGGPATPRSRMKRSR